MAIVWGVWAKRDSEFWQRLGIDLSVSGTTITAKYYVETTGTISQSARTLTKSGTRGSSYTFAASFPLFWGGTASVSGVSITVPAAVPSKPAKPTISNVSSGAFQINYSNPSGNGAAVNGMRIQVSNVSNFSSFVWNYIDADGSPAGPYGLEANMTYYVRIAARNSAGEGPFSDVVTPTTSPLAPLVPSNVVLTRVNDSAQTVKWQVNVTGERPVSQIFVNRRDNVNTSWVRVATLNGAPTSFTDTSTVANRRYEYIVSASNAGGQSGWTVSTAINTSPAAPSNVAAVKSGSNIAVSWKRNALYSGVTQHVIQDNPGGTGWVTVATVGAVDSWTHTSVNASVTHQYRVLAKSTVNAVLDSAWSSTSAVVQLLAPPLAPTVLAPSGVLDYTKAIVWKWDHNPVDTTAQSQAQVQFRRVGQPTWSTETVTTANTVSVVPSQTAGVLEFQIRTRGEHATYGPWSAVKTFTLASVPSVVINDPADGSTLDQSKVTTTWGYSSDDASPQAQWEATLKQGSSTLETRAGTGTASTVAFNRALSDQQTYTIQVRVRSASGLWSSWDSSSFTTDFPMPVTVEVIPEWDVQTGAVSLTFGELPVPGPNETIPETLDVQRQIGDGEWVTIAVDIPVDGAVIDPLPSLRYANRYRAISKTTLPTSADGQSIEIVWEPPATGTHFYLNGGPAFGMVCHVSGHIASEAPTLNSVLHHFGTSPHPVVYFGSERTDRLTFTGNLVDDSTPREEWLRLSVQPYIVCYRDRRGRREFGRLTLVTNDSAGVVSISGTLAITHWEEGVSV